MGSPVLPEDHALLSPRRSCDVGDCPDHGEALVASDQSTGSPVSSEDHALSSARRSCDSDGCPDHGKALAAREPLKSRLYTPRGSVTPRGSMAPRDSGLRP